MNKYLLLLLVPLLALCKPENKHAAKMKIKIDKNWNVNGLVLGKTHEAHFTKSDWGRNTVKSPYGQTSNIIYKNTDNDYYFCFYASTIEDHGGELKISILKEYAIADFDLVEVSFENGLKSGAQMADVIKLFDKSQIENYAALKSLNSSDSLKIKKEDLSLAFSFSNNKLSGIHVKKL